MNRMKVTAIIPDALVSDVQRLARRKNLTESIVAALTEWAALQRIRELNRRSRETAAHVPAPASAATRRPRAEPARAVIIADTSIWVEFLRSREPGPRAAERPPGARDGSCRGGRLRGAAERSPERQETDYPGSLLEEPSEDRRDGDLDRGGQAERSPGAAMPAGSASLMRLFWRSPPERARRSGRWTVGCGMPRDVQPRG